MANDTVFKTVAGVLSVHECQWHATHVDAECATHDGAMLLRLLDAAAPHGCRCMRRAATHDDTAPCHLDPNMRGWDVFLYIGACVSEGGAAPRGDQDVNLRAQGNDGTCVSDAARAGVRKHLWLSVWAQPPCPSCVVR